MAYVDGFLLKVPTKKLADYKKMATIAAKVWKDHGALDYKECAGEDLAPKGPMPMQQFHKLVGAAKNETTIFAFIVYKNRKHRDQVNAKVMKDKRLMESCDPENMPFDCSQMAYGGFEAIVDSANIKVSKKKPAKKTAKKPAKKATKKKR